MKKYWLLVALLGTAACSGATTEDGGSNQAAVSDGDKGKPDAGEPTTKPADGNEPTTKPADGTEPATKPADGNDDKKVWEPAPAYDCQADLDKLAAASQEATDPEQLAMIKQKYEQLRESCVPPATEPAGDKPDADKPGTEPAEPYDCQADLDKLAAASQETTDAEQLAMIKQKYAILRDYCNPDVNKEPPTKDPPKDGTIPATK